MKVIRAEDEEIAGAKQVRLQHVLIGDSSGQIWLALWENNIAKLETGECHVLKRVRVKEFRGEKSLSATYGSVFEKVAEDEIGDVSEKGIVSKWEDRSESILEGAVVVGVGKLEQFVQCITATCKARVRYEEGAGFGECSKCGTFQRTKGRAVQLVAELKIECDNGEHVSGNAYAEVARQLTGVKSSAVTKELLIESEKFDGKMIDGVLKSIVRGNSEEQPAKKRKMMAITEQCRTTETVYFCFCQALHVYS